MPDSVPKKGGVEVRSILAPVQPAGGEGGPDFRSAEVKKRTNHARAGGGANAAQSRGPGAAQETPEDGFGLIVFCMAGRHGIAMTFGDLRGEEVVAGGARGLLHISRQGRCCRHEDRQLEPRGQIADEPLIKIRFLSAQLMVYMQDCGGDTEIGQRMQQEHGIGAARYRDSDPPEPEGRNLRTHCCHLARNRSVCARFCFCWRPGF